MASFSLIPSKTPTTKAPVTAKSTAPIAVPKVTTPAYKAPSSPLVLAPKAPNYSAPKPAYGPTNTPKGVLSSSPAYASNGNYYSAAGNQQSTGLGGLGQVVKKIASSSKGSSNGASALGAFYGATSGSSSADNGVSESADVGSNQPTGYEDSYGGRSGYSTSSFSGPAGAAGGNSVATEEDNGVAGERSQRQQFLNTAEQNRNAQTAAIQGKIDTVEKAREAALAAAAGAGVADAQDNQEEISEQPSVNPFEEEIKNLYAELENAKKMTPEEEEAKRLEDQYNAQEAQINASTNAGIADVEAQPIAASFISGQSAALQKMANAKLGTIAAQKIPVQQKLARLAAQRAAASDVVKEKMSYTGKKFDRAEDREKENRQNKFTLDRDEKQFANDRKKPVTLSEGEMYYDPLSGTKLSRPKTYAPVRPTQPTTPQSYREWELAGKPDTYAKWIDRNKTGREV